MNELRCENIEFSYGKKQILNGVSLEVSNGEIVAITGKSGVGKSTLAYILSGVIPQSIDRKYSGNVLICEKNILKMQKKELVSKVGIVFQNPDMQIFSQTVEDEIAFGMENLNFPREKMRETITNLLKFVGLEGYEKINPSNLSGGQKQLVTFCSVLAVNPSILIMDEAMSMLDEDSSMMILKLMLKLKSVGKAVVYVEHNEERLKIADKIYNLQNGILTRSNV